LSPKNLQEEDEEGAELLGALLGGGEGEDIQPKMDSTETTAQMAQLVREESKEEEYDYFLDANKDENHLNLKGYHITDQADLVNDSAEEKPMQGGDDFSDL